MTKKEATKLTKQSLINLLNAMEKQAFDEQDCDEGSQGEFNGIVNTIDHIRKTYGLPAPDTDKYAKRGTKPGELFDPDKYPAGDGCKGCNAESRKKYRCEDCEVGLDDGEEE
jgi:hypothetical protein